MTTPEQARKIADIAFSKGAALAAETILDLARQVEELQQEKRLLAILLAEAAKPEKTPCPVCNGSKVIGTPGERCPFCVIHELGDTYSAAKPETERAAYGAFQANPMGPYYNETIAFTPHGDSMASIESEKAYNKVDRYLRNNMDDTGYKEFSQALDLIYAIPKQTADSKDCTRSHPHEEMGTMCALRTEIARLQNKIATMEADKERLEDLLAEACQARDSQ